MNLQQNCSSLAQENKKLKLMLQKNNQNNNKIEPNYELMENSIKQGNILLKQKILVLEKQNKELNYKLIESNQKIKKLQNNNKNIDTNTNDEINKLKNIIDENEIKISKLELDKKSLEQKLEDYQRAHQNEIKLMLDYKNSELSVYQNLVDKYKNNTNNNNSNINNNNNSNNLTLKNVQMQINKMKQEIASKNNIINSLNKKISQFNEDYNKKLLELKQSSNENINQTQEQVEQLIIERDELLRKNENLTRGLMQFNDKVKEVNIIYNNKTENYNKNILAFKEKLKEYKLKVNALKKKNDELNMIIKKYKINSNNDIYSNNFYNYDEYCLTNRYDNYNKYLERRVESPYIGNRKNVFPYTDNRNNMKNNNMTFTYERNENNFNINPDYMEDQLDLSQKKYLENYKSFLSGLDDQLSK
jgi:chromosome segregation ATPase